MTRELVLSNAAVVTATEMLAPASLRVADGAIVDVSRGATRADGAIDCEGDYVIPGGVELHTDALERHLHPRPHVVWPLTAALAAHDGVLSAAGITTACEAITVGIQGHHTGLEIPLARVVRALDRFTASGHARIDHFVHLRCETGAHDMEASLRGLIAERSVRVVSLMDHTPGQRQWRNRERHQAYRLERAGRDDVAELAIPDELAADNRGKALALLAQRPGPVALLVSHDDTTEDHVRQAAREGVRLSEFPTTLEAAVAARRQGLAVAMGAPNLLLGRSHSGNVAAIDIFREGALDILSSDYAPGSLLQGAFALYEAGAALPAAIAMISVLPARLLGFNDRGEIAAGQRADLVRCRVPEDAVVVRGVWHAGRRVH